MLGIGTALQGAETMEPTYCCLDLSQVERPLATAWPVAQRLGRLVAQDRRRWMLALPAEGGTVRARRALAELDRAGIGEVRIGLGRHEVLAALAAALARPGEVRSATRADVPALLWPLPVDELWGVGPVLAAVLRREGYATVADLATAGPDRLRAQLGPRGAALWAAAHGRDPLARAPVRCGA
jgi:nucleotidyltransferase/DNA polymerase involved in DNA repair